MVLDHGVALQLLRVLEARERVADRRAHRDVGDRRVDVRRLGQRNRVVARIARAHRQQLGDVAAAGAAVDADLRRVAVPRRRFRFQPAHAVVGVLHARRIRRFRRQRHVDGDDQHAARGQRAIHRLFGVAILGVPRAAVQIEHGGERSRAVRLIDARHQHPPGRRAPELDLADGDLELRRGIVVRFGGGSDRHDSREIRGAAPDERRDARKAGCTEGGDLSEKVAAAGRTVSHADLRCTLSATTADVGKRRLGGARTGRSNRMARGLASCRGARSGP